MDAWFNVSPKAFIMTDALSSKAADLDLATRPAAASSTAISGSASPSSSRQPSASTSPTNSRFSRSNFGIRSGTDPSQQQLRRGSVPASPIRPVASSTAAAAERERSQLLRSISHLTKTQQRPPSTSAEDDTIEFMQSAGLSTAHIIGAPVTLPPPGYDFELPSASRSVSRSAPISRSRSSTNVHDTSTTVSPLASSSSPPSTTHLGYPGRIQDTSTNTPSSSLSALTKRKASVPNLALRASAFKSRDNGSDGVGNLASTAPPPPTRSPTAAKAASAELLTSPPTGAPRDSPSSPSSPPLALIQQPMASETARDRNPSTGSTSIHSHSHSHSHNHSSGISPRASQGPDPIASTSGAPVREHGASSAAAPPCAPSAVGVDQAASPSARLPLTQAAPPSSSASSPPASDPSQLRPSPAQPTVQSASHGIALAAPLGRSPAKADLALPDQDQGHDDPASGDTPAPAAAAAAAASSSSAPGTDSSNAMHSSTRGPSLPEIGHEGPSPNGRLTQLSAAAAARDETFRQAAASDEDHDTHQSQQELSSPLATSPLNSKLQHVAAYPHQADAQPPSSFLSFIPEDAAASTVASAASPAHSSNRSAPGSTVPALAASPAQNLAPSSSKLQQKGHSKDPVNDPRVTDPSSSSSAGPDSSSMMAALLPPLNSFAVGQAPSDSKRISFDLPVKEDFYSTSLGGRKTSLGNQLPQHYSTLEEHPFEDNDEEAERLTGDREPPIQGGAMARSGMLIAERANSSSAGHGSSESAGPPSIQQSIAGPSSGSSAMMRNQSAPHSQPSPQSDETGMAGHAESSKPRRSSMTLDRMKQWASRSSSNLSGTGFSSSRSRRGSEAGGDSTGAESALPRKSRLSISGLRSSFTTNPEASANRFSKTAFMRSRPSLGGTAEDEANIAAAVRSSWIKKPFRKGRRSSVNHVVESTQSGDTAGSPAIFGPVQAPDEPAVSVADAQETFDSAFGPVQRASPVPDQESLNFATPMADIATEIRPGLASDTSYNWNAASIAKSGGPATVASDDVGPMGESLTATSYPASNVSLDARSWASSTNTSSTSAAGSIAPSQRSSSSVLSNQTALTDHLGPPSVQNEGGAGAVHKLEHGSERAARPLSLIAFSDGDDGTIDSRAASTVHGDEDFVDAREELSSRPATAMSQRSAATQPPTSVDTLTGRAFTPPRSSSPAIVATSSGPRQHAQGSSRSHISQMPRLESMRSVPRANGGGSGGDGGGDPPSQGSGAGDDSANNGGGSGSDHSSDEETDRSMTENETETETDEEDETEGETEDEGDESDANRERGESSVSMPGFLPPVFVQEAAPDASAPSTSPLRSALFNRPSGISLPPAPVFATPAPAKTPSAHADGPVGRNSWTQFASSPMDTPTPGIFDAGATKTPLASLQGGSYFNQRPAAARYAGNGQTDNMPPPSPSVITRSRAPSSASNPSSSRIVPGRELPPPLPSLQALSLTAVSPGVAGARPSTGPSRLSGLTVRPAQSSSALSPSASTISSDAARAPRSPLASLKPSSASNSRTASPHAALAAARDGEQGQGSQRPGLYSQQSRSLIDLPSSGRFRELSAHGHLNESASGVATPGTPGSLGLDFAARPPPTPMDGVFNEGVLTDSPVQRRRSMVEMTATPPPYAIIHRRPEGPQMIFPREDEGTEKLPKYSCAVHIEGYLPRKMEFTSPGQQAKDRSWRRCYFVLHGTCMKVYRNDLSSSTQYRADYGEMGGVHVHPDPINEDGTNGGVSVGAGMNLLEAIQHSNLNRNDKYGQVRNYSLQGAESGLAADYLKRRHVVRVRLEGEQFLLQTTSDRHVVDWIEALQAATNVSQDLESRAMPKFITLPRRRRRRRARDVEAAQIADATRRSLEPSSAEAAAAASGNAIRSTSSGHRRDQSRDAGNGDRLDEMLREEQDQLVRPTQSASVV